MNAATSFMEADVHAEANEDVHLLLTDEQLVQIAGGQCTTNSI